MSSPDRCNPCEISGTQVPFASQAARHVPLGHKFLLRARSSYRLAGVIHVLRRPETLRARRRQAVREVAKLAKKGRLTSAVVIDRREMTKTLRGKAWCDDLECYSDYENRLPRGRTHARNGSVVDLQSRPVQ